jgi:hypothetical protein
MKTHISYTVLKAVRLIADAPQQTLSKVAARLGGSLPPRPSSIPPPAHVTLRLETVFEELSELALQPHIAAALDLACDTLQAELPTEAIAAGLYDIDNDEIRIVAARGLGHELSHGFAMPRARCFAGQAAERAIITTGNPDGVDWLGRGGEGSTVLLCPILHDAHLLGMIALADPLCSAEFNHHDIELVAYVAGQLAEFVQAFRQRARAAAASDR